MAGEAERFAAAAAAIEERIASVHEGVACPKCGAALGARCRRAGVYATRHGWLNRPVLKHSHVERVRAAGIPLR